MDNIALPIFRAQALASSDELPFQHIPGETQEVIELYWIIKGEGKLSIDFFRDRFPDRTLFFVLPGQVYHLEPEGEWLGSRITFSLDLLTACDGTVHAASKASYLARLQSAGIVTLDEENADEINEIFDIIFLETRYGHGNRNEMLSALLALLISYIPHSGDQNPAGHAFKSPEIVFGKFISKIDESFCTQKQVLYYASELAVTPNYLSEVSKKVSGFSARHHIHQRVVLEAKRKAMATGMRAKQIAFDLGFEDPSTFSKFFRIVAGESFSDFRKKEVCPG